MPSKSLSRTCGRSKRRPVQDAAQQEADLLGGGMTMPLRATQRGSTRPPGQLSRSSNMPIRLALDKCDHPDCIALPQPTRAEGVVQIQISFPESLHTLSTYPSSQFSS